MPAPDRPTLDRLDLSRLGIAEPWERWEAVTLHGVHTGFLHRVLEDGVLTTRMAFEPHPAQRRAAAELPERFLAQSTLEFGVAGEPWTAATYEDSITEQRVRIDRERAGLGPHAVPSWAELPLIAQTAGQELAFERLEEASPLQGGLRVLPAVLRPTDAGGSGRTRVELVSEGHVLAVHVVHDGEVVASDWGGGTASEPVAGREQALAGLSAVLTAFADRPRG
ncbi:hypothetical protein [Micrococcus sp.]|uniref:hypothetical protein n=1 Tax=Micrococcus sp. TaxID=1271 RepID=UPI002A91B303|nr:hypothetical protein [Micrococcus sp.]MDY6055499.1 hypothetical protein [Micrococcus sp.]